MSIRSSTTALRDLASATLLGAMTLIVFAQTARAEQHGNLQAGFPTVIEDSLTAGPGGLRIDAQLRWDQLDTDDQFALVPQITWGMGDRVELRAAVPLISGGDRTGSGNVRFEGLYKFLDLGDDFMPGIAGLAAFELPTGTNTSGVDTTLKLLATSAIGGRESLYRLHFNMGWTNNSQADFGERAERWMYGLGYSQPFGPMMTLVADLVREEGRKAGQRGTVAEVGLRWMASPATIASVGVGVGSGGIGPDWRLVAGLQMPL